MAQINLIQMPCCVCCGLTFRSGVRSWLRFYFGLWSMRPSSGSSCVKLLEARLDVMHAVICLGSDSEFIGHSVAKFALRVFL